MQALFEGFPVGPTTERHAREQPVRLRLPESVAGLLEQRQRLRAARDGRVLVETLPSDLGAGEEETGADLGRSVAQALERLRETQVRAAVVAEGEVEVP